MVKVAVIGASGYTGGELIRILSNHKDVEISALTSRKYNGKNVSKVHPHIRNTNFVFEDLDTKDIDADLIITATPHGASMNIVPDIVERGYKCIDLSGDYRFEDIATYEKWYELEHTSRENEISAVYGLPEIHRDEIKNAQLVANPGCFPTGAILAGLPLSKENLVENIIFDSKTGISGAGISPNEATHYPTCADNVNPYKVTTHRHSPEIQKELAKFSNIRTSFTPHLVPVIRGILTTSHSFLNSKSNESSQDYDSEKIAKLYKKFYKNEPFIRVLDDGEIPKLSAVRGSNFADIGCFEVDENNHLVIISAIDNLVKGASGQAVHNMNIMFGFKETESLDYFGLHP
ncbi:MAG: N-acetyl-gamma-glutamyl-phosphate reductase [Methanobacteriaceae archaeon]